MRAVKSVSANPTSQNRLDTKRSSVSKCQSAVFSPKLRGVIKRRDLKITKRKRSVNLKKKELSDFRLSSMMTHHADERADERNIKEKRVVHCLQHGVVISKIGRRARVVDPNRNLTIIVSVKDGKVITMFRANSSDLSRASRLLKHQAL